MPGSPNFGKVYTTLIVKKLSDNGYVNSILDIGAGSGTYFDLLSPHLPDVEWTGVEVWEAYIDRFDLAGKYQNLINKDVRLIDFEKEPRRDLTLFGDVLEHMTKEEAQKIIAGILPKSRAIMISIPVIHYPQGEVDGNPYERHIKDDWSHQEVVDSFPDILTVFIHDHIGVYFLSIDDEVSATITSIQAPISTMVEKHFPKDQIVWG